jgi:hypothetical protein
LGLQRPRKQGHPRVLKCFKLHVRVHARR